MQNIRQTIVDAGGVFRFESRVTDLKIEKGRIRGVWCGDSLIEGAAVVLATGHSARDIYELLHRRGVRIARSHLHPAAIARKARFRRNAVPQMPAVAAVAQRHSLPCLRRRSLSRSGKRI